MFPMRYELFLYYKKFVLETTIWVMFWSELGQYDKLLDTFMQRNEEKKAQSTQEYKKEHEDIIREMNEGKREKKNKPN